MTKLDLDQVANRREQILFAMVAFVFVILFFRVFYAQQARKMETAGQKVQALTLERDALVKFSQVTPTLQKSETLSRRKGIKMKILYGEVKGAVQEATALLAQLTESAFLGRVAVQTMSFQPPVAERGYWKTDFSLNVLGSFVDVVQYLERLEQFPALFNVEQVSLRAAEGQPQELQAEIQGRFFRLDEKAGGNKK